jgi:hypothetical protein
MDNKESTILSIKQRILSEFKKHYSEDSDDWAHVAAARIYATHIESVNISDTKVEVVQLNAKELEDYLKGLGC